MKDCIFCKIIRGEAPAVRVWENENFLAVLDIKPAIEGMSVVMPKKHFNSYALRLPDKVYQDFLLAAKNTAAVLRKGLKAQRVFLAIEGLDVDHAHIKLYPLQEEIPLGKVLERTSRAPIKEIKELEQTLAKIKENL